MPRVTKKPSRPKPSPRAKRVIEAVPESAPAPIAPPAQAPVPGGGAPTTAVAEAAPRQTAMPEILAPQPPTQAPEPPSQPEPAPRTPAAEAAPAAPTAPPPPPSPEPAPAPPPVPAAPDV